MGCDRVVMTLPSTDSSGIELPSFRFSTFKNNGHGGLAIKTLCLTLTAALTSERVNEKMDLLSMEFSSGTSKPLSKMPKKQNKKKLQDGEEKLYALKHMADDDNRTSGSTWIETLKTCLLSPCEVVAKCGGEGSISDAVRRTVVRRTLYTAWTGLMPLGACVKPSRRGKICGKRQPSLSSQSTRSASAHRRLQISIQGEPPQ